MANITITDDDERPGFGDTVTSQDRLRVSGRLACPGSWQMQAPRAEASNCTVVLALPVSLERAAGSPIAPTRPRIQAMAGLSPCAGPKSR